VFLHEQCKALLSILITPHTDPKYHVILIISRPASDSFDVISVPNIKVLLELGQEQREHAVAGSFDFLFCLST
jgi:hypothetical protein